MLEPEEPDRRLSTGSRRSRRPGFTRLLQELEEEHESDMAMLRTQLEGELRYLRTELDRLRMEQDRFKKGHKIAKIVESTPMASMRLSRRSKDHVSSVLPASSPLGAQWRERSENSTRAKQSRTEQENPFGIGNSIAAGFSTGKKSDISHDWSRSHRQMSSMDRTSSNNVNCSTSTPKMCAVSFSSSVKKGDSYDGTIEAAAAEPQIPPPSSTKLTGDWDVTPLAEAFTPSSSALQQSSALQSSANQLSRQGGSSCGSNSLPSQEAKFSQGSSAATTEYSQEDPQASRRTETHHARFLYEGPKKTIDRFMVSPVGKPRLMWDLLVFSVLILDFLITPFELVFLLEDSVPKGFSVANSIITIFFMADICLNFNTGFIVRDKLIMKRKDSVHNYLTTWFFIDLVSTIPYDLVMSTAMSTRDGNAVSMTRVIKVSKALKTLRFMKMLRAVHLAKSLNDNADFWDTCIPMQYLGPLFKGFTGLALLAHAHGCVWAVLQPGRTGSDSMKEALENYYRCFYWAYQALAVGPTVESLDQADIAGIWTLEIIIAAERITLVALLGSWGFVKAMSLFHEGAQLSLVKQDALRVFRSHHVSVETQIQVMYSIHETRWAQQRQRHFRQLMSEHLPEELRRTISAEIWTEHLLSLGLLLRMNDWHRDFITELCQVIREEVLASRTILCREGNAATCAYYVLEGRLTVVGSHSYGLVPDFVAGMWVGEMALVTPARRRNATVATQCLTTLMTVPADAFSDLVERLGLQPRFEHFRKAQLAQGLCGRCGILGDHFTHACPLAADVDVGVFRPLSRRLTRKNTSAWGAVARQLTECNKVDSRQSASPASLEEFLHAHRISRLAPFLRAEGIEAMEDIGHHNLHDFMDRVRDQGDSILLKEADLLRALQLELQGKLDANMRPDQHLVFLSHFKMEAGTEAALIHSELDKALCEELDMQTDCLQRTRIFLDSEDLYDLEDLQQHVRGSNNLVVMLTKNVLTRPWVLVEIVTAVQAGVRLVPVQLVKPGESFVFPQDTFYTDLLQGRFLDESGHELLKQHSIKLQDVESALRELFKKIAVPYSPHRPESIRKAEVKALLKLCNLSDWGDERCIVQSFDAGRSEFTLGRTDNDCGRSLKRTGSMLSMADKAART